MIIVGKMASGKSTLAKFFCNHGYKEYAFADNLKAIVNLVGYNMQGSIEMLYELAPYKNVSMLVPLLEHTQAIQDSPHNRLRLQYFGQAVRDIYPNYWIDSLRQKIEKETPPYYVISDCRYKNEFDAFRETNLTLFLNVPDEVRKKRIVDRDGFYDIKSFNHPSETELEGLKYLCDIVIPQDYYTELRDEIIKGIKMSGSEQAYMLEFTEYE
jgi:dephospho-CoA kinase